MQNPKFALAFLQERTTDTGKTILFATMGKGGPRIHIEELPEPTEGGATFGFWLLAPKEPKEQKPRRPEQTQAEGPTVHDADGTLVAYFAGPETIGAAQR